MSCQQVIQRAKNLLFQPETEWESIQKENRSSRSIIRYYLLPMVLFTGASALVGGTIYHSGYGLNVSYILSSTVICLVVSYAVVYLSALIINEIAHNFGSAKDRAAVMALVSYSSTAFFVSYAAANLLNIPPLNSLLSLCGLYALYILWTGSTPMLQIPAESRIKFTITSGLIMLGVYFAFRLLLEAVFAGPLSGV
ncbi:MAG: Yip1 family protein [Bacteroidales bacterium]